MDSDPDALPINPLPAGVVMLALPMLAVEIAFLAGAEGFVGGPEAVGWRIAAWERYGFFVQLLDYAAGTGRWDAPILMRFVTYPFVHAGFLHLVMVLVFLLALGKLVGEAMGSLAVIVLFFVSAVAGAVAYGLVAAGPMPLIGGYPGVYGLIGGYSFLLWTHARATGGPQHRAFGLIAMLLLIQLIFGALYGGGADWVAEVAGFAAGFLGSFVVVPGGWARVLGLMRKR